MITIRRSDERGHADHGWLDTYHTFSFADYHDPAHMAFRVLRVMNEDRVAPGQGFGMHPHHDMEIVTLVLEGALEHRDSLGNGELLRPGELQRMTAGTGITHSEFNPSRTEPVHLYQIWIFPERRGLEPSYEQRAFDPVGRRNALQLVASRDGAEGSLRIHQDARIHLANLEPGKSLELEVAAGRHAWLQVLRGAATVGGHELAAGDGASASGPERIAVTAAAGGAGAGAGAELMLFDLP
ncbi:MAG: pirin family protein [Phycisphaerales bacterium]